MTLVDRSQAVVNAVEAALEVATVRRVTAYDDRLAHVSAASSRPDVVVPVGAVAVAAASRRRRRLRRRRSDAAAGCPSSAEVLPAPSHRPTVSWPAGLASELTLVAVICVEK